MGKSGPDNHEWLAVAEIGAVTASEAQEVESEKGLAPIVVGIRVIVMENADRLAFYG